MSESVEEPFLMELVHAIVAGDQSSVAKLLSQHQHLAQTGLRCEARRGEQNTHFFQGIQHQLYRGDTGLHAAAAALNLKIAANLVTHGAALGAKNRHGHEPLHYACDSGPIKNIWHPEAQEAVISYLIDSGANANAVDKRGVAPLHRAVRTRSSNAVRALLAGGAQVQIKNDNGSTPLHLAVQNTGRGGSGMPISREHQVSIIELLLKNGADVNARDNQGKTVLQWIREESIKKLFVLLIALIVCSSASADAATAKILRFSAPVASPAHRSSSIDYNINPANASFAACIPEQMKAAEGNQWGLIVFIGSESVTDIPADWLPVLTRRKLIFISPQNAGNSCNQPEREGLAVMAAKQMIARYGLNTSRIYSAGFSGGARTACDLGFQQSDLFSATIQSCGTDFYRRVPAVNANSQIDTNGNEYGLTAASAEEIADAKRKVRFFLITGQADFRHGNIVDIYNNGFVPERFQAKLLDIGTMGHEICSGYALEQALIFIEGR